ncbi:hypothetical protein LAZ67_1001526, partial [Cordylochernes scorpioides]
MSRDERILQRKLSCQIRRIDGFIESVDSIIEADETIRLEIMGEELKEIKEKIEKLYDELFSLDEVDIDKESEAYDGSMNKIGSLRVKIENERKLKDKLADIKPNGSQANIKLPQFDLPIYDGDLGNWINFKELFLTTIDAHPGLTNIQKLQYLNSAVKGEAARLIRGFPLLSENYGQAWNTLLSRYDNPRELAYAQVSKIFSLRAIKNPSAKCLHEFMDVCNEAIRNLETLELKRNQLVDVILVHFLQQKLSENLRLDWELSVDNTLPSYDKFIAFISRHARSMSCAVRECSKREETTGSRFPKCQSYGMLIEKSDTCILCKSKHHPLYMCNLFCKMPLKEKLNVVKGHKLCFNCLRKGHFSWNCRLNQRCKVCKGKHHTMIHYDKPSTEGASAQVENTTPKENESAINLTNTQQANCNDSHVLLATARIKIKNGLGKLCTCRALLDSGSQVTMITKGCCERLGLVQRKSDRMIIGVGNTPVQHSSSTVSVTFCPLNNSEEFSVEAVVTGVLTSEIPNFRLKDPNWPTLKSLKLADPEFYIQAPIDMILGADIYTELMLNGSISLGEGLPMAINTRLGWVLLGKLMGTSESNTEVCNLSLQSEPELEFVMKRFWETESVPSPDLCTQDEDCERLFSNNHGRDSHGRYWVKLPFRQHRPLLGESREKALRRFLSLEGKLCKNVKLYDQYRGFMKEYEHLNHMERVPIAEVKRKLCRCYYMPHHPVIREQSTTTKMRVVFDASAKSENNVSLNQFLHKGPKIQQDVFFILLRFRTYPVAITADIEKMYRQIRIHPEDADYQRILWRPSPEEPVVDYRLLTVTYGTTSAPFLAMRTLQQLAEDEGHNYPEASRVTLNDFYVDDLLTGAQTIAETKELIDQLKDLMKKGGFHLRKWNSNCQEIVSHVEEMNEEKKINLEKGAISKILGIVWDHVQDTFRVNITLPEEVVTKRDLLSNIARIFDPLGFLSPTTVALKIIMQELWRSGTGWDEHIPNDIKEKWNNFRAELLKLGDLSIPRYVWACEKDQDVQLHGFCDASGVAYSAVCYLRTVSLDGQVHISMLAAKTRVAPCKSLTLPRLELCAALLLSQLYRSVVDSLKIDIGRAYLWSDSQISLSWIKSDPNRWKTFIHNRVVKIQQLSDRNSWRHVSGKDNPADCASRGIMPAALSGHTLWWQGPTWLKDNNFVQNQDNCYGRECHEEEKVALACQSRVSVCPEVVTKYSTFIKTRRILAWCLRFITNCRVSLKKREIGTLSKKELENAVIKIIGWIQKDEFGEEMQDLRNTGHVSRKSRILQLNPFIDASGMLRVGGRIKYANVNPDQKFPLLLPKNHHFTKLIILHFHTRYLHAGPQLVLSLIRNSYWIMGGRDIVRRIIKQCITCFRFRAKTAVQIMGNLPADRVNPSRPFTKTGVDLAGPYELKPSLTRSKGTIKCYVILFVCFSVKAIHLEMVTSLSTSSFIAALRRFISRRGKPSKIYSDNGTNFRGTESFMKKQYKIMNSKETKDFLAEELIEWHFIPPSAPHFGGLWEANIKCLKGHLSKVIKSSLLNSEEFITLLCQVEACLNSRPLVELSPDPNDLRALTPGHFLIGSPLIEDPGLQNYEQGDLRSRWNLVQGLRNSFWSRWTREYINSLQQRNKWRLSQDNLKPNQLVLIKEDNLPPLKWRLARILKVYPGSDQKVRVAQVRAATGVYLRPITKLAPLPFKSEPGFSGRGENTITRTTNEIKSGLSLEEVDIILIRAKFERLTVLNDRLILIDDKIKEILLDDPRSTEAQINDEMELCETYSLQVGIVAQKVKEYESKLAAPCDDKMSQSSTSDVKRQIKLPKFELKKYTGELEEWLSWWSHFEKIHLDESLSDVDKFEYLIQSMVVGSKAHRLVTSFPLTQKNYNKVIGDLKDRFGDRDMLTELYVRKLLKLVIASARSEKRTLAQLYDDLVAHLHSLGSLGVDTKSGGGAFLYPLVESSLPLELIKIWQRSRTPFKERDYSEIEEGIEHSGAKAFDKLEGLIEFLKQEVKNAERISFVAEGFEPSLPLKQGKRENNPPKIHTASALFVGKTNLPCLFCDKDNHLSQNCFKAAKMLESDRLKRVQDAKVCFKCLRNKHLKKDCRSFVRCKRCQGPHFEIMCRGTSHSQENSNWRSDNRSHNSLAEQNEGISEPVTAMANQVCTNNISLMTLIVKLKGPKRSKMVRVLLDSGSQKSYIRRSLAKELDLPKVGEVKLNKFLFGGQTTGEKAHSIFYFQLDNVDKGKAFKMEALEETIICGNISPVETGPRQWELDKKGITLTKVDNNKTEIDILIGGDYYGQLLTGKIEQLAGGLTAIQTVLGWTLIGNTSSERPETSAQMVITLLTTQQRVASLWELETIGIRDPTEVISVKEKNVLMQEKFREKICRGHDGRYLVSLPWKEGIGTIPNNLEIAKRRLEAMTQKLTQKGQFVPYDEVFRSWFRENLIEEVDREDIRPTGHYLPHRPIYKVQSETTPIRPVYDASCKASKRSLSLNECLETGPNLIELLPEILIRFREKKIGAIADIRKAFQTVGIDEKERFHKEYLAMLVQKRNETEGRRFLPGEVVLIGRDDQKRIFWPLGRILELYPGKDGRERVARVRTATGEFVRPLKRLFSLELGSDISRE